MRGEEDATAGPPSDVRRTYWRSSSWSSSRIAAQDHSKDSTSEDRDSTIGPPRCCPPPPFTPRSQSQKARSCLPPLAITRRSLDEWPKPEWDDLEEWPHQPKPPPLGVKPDEGVKLDLSLLKSPGRRDQIAFKECSKVADHVYLGGDYVARDREILRQHGITHVLNWSWLCLPEEYLKSDLICKTHWLQQDSPSNSILYDAFDYFLRTCGSKVGGCSSPCCQGVRFTVDFPGNSLHT